MNKRAGQFGLGALALVTGVTLAGGMMMNHSVARHHQGMRVGVPEPYRDMRNSLPESDAVIAEGEQLYQANCAACHGKQGYGDGPAGKPLSPRPANLNHFMQMRMMARDNYLIWTISEGGKRFNTAMPAFKETLGEEDRWKIIHFLRTL
ncbi:c-type cytochrome [endosymbiont of Ridgeia piscesae]|jgi:mono/diheme cytochrome c family protein|uniref:Cytochrome C oxidase, cbb3-type, subunit III n=1 Tax=endosymbiont of Ridgeia piscesae TaxID=54398 RepID=A0A0T5Z756_9GAMM|nr:cytochrome c [endosymbiont of Ridgeia piscesae]KRT54372.1 Cytochrome C oxidase, cbb3-type, subunit III [endosymbiont of Ridgeia piscesae]KRT58748.1 Cytochrome C oxidase, cbb3-type, subunit III [endosymbiont of Ridgeia piscesae]